ncbi:MAG: ABC-F family ATP-binding cassette domain-containing protein [Lachnospiraceae bacterium]|nr:ABC-F family ATP-binding cassette domain-containing protein [Lachnospiraceae bacterium]
MNILTVDNITKAYGVRKIFDNASFYLQEGEKAGIIGINGTGKTTLLKIIAGIESPDTGSVIMANNLTVRYLPQTPVFNDSDTVLQAVVRDNKTEDNQWTIESDAKSMMTKLGIDDFDELCGHLSGGQKKRLALVSVLLAKPDILLLDEPTNHLDNEMSTWLEEQLKSYRGSIIMITHDRYFLDSVATRIIEVDKGSIYSYEENYSGYLNLKTLREDIADAQERKRQSILRVELEWVKRGARARSTKQKARLERYEELKNTAAPVKDESVELGSMASRLGKTTIELHNISKSFDGRTIIKDFSYNFLKNDRIGIIGPNGAGKSTLLKMIMGEYTPDAGSIEIGPTVRIGYFAQEVKLGEDMDPNQRVIDYIRDVAEFVETEDGRITATRLLERFLFKGEDQYGLIGKLSGGERRRLYLCKVLMSAPNVLILDEPTNDLDITTLTVLEDYLDHFNGIVITVSHDRYFLDRVVRRIFAFNSDGTLRQSEGGYTDYEIRVEFEKRELGNVNVTGGKTNSSKASGGNNQAPETPADNWKQKPREKKLKFSYNEQKEYETIEEDIAKLEDKLASVESDITKFARDFAKLNDLTNEKEKLEEELLEKMERWEYLEELAAAIEAQKRS